MSSTFALDKSNARLMGVCAGIARSTGADALIVRLIVVLLTFFALGPIALFAYVLIGWLAESR